MEENIKEVIERLSMKAITSKLEEKDYPTCIVFKKDLINILNELERIQKENERLKEKHKITCKLNVGLLENMKECIPKHVIRDKFKRINETKIKIDKTNARDYMIFGNTERATGWFINIDYIEKILLDVPGYKIGDE